MMAEKKNAKNINKSIFSKENINIGHQSELDYLKAMDIFLMILLHVYDNYSKGYLYHYIDFISFILGAAGFMLLMGIGMKYSRHHEPKNYFDRAFVLLTMGQYLNILRDSLPNLIAWWYTGNKKFIARALNVVNADILTFAGISYILLGLMKIIKLSDNCILIISIFMNIVAYPLHQIIKPPNNYFLNLFLGFFILTNAESYFSLCSYFIFVAFGYWLGGICQKISNKDKFYNNVLIICLPTSIIYYYFRSHYDFPFFPEYLSEEGYCLSPGPDAIATCMVNLSALAIFHKIDKILGKTPVFIIEAGKKLNQYYILSYFFIIPLKTFLSATRGDDFPSKLKYPTLFALMVLVITTILIDMNDKYIHLTIFTLKNPLRNIIFAFIWIISIIIIIYAYPKVDTYATMWNDYLYEV